MATTTAASFLATTTATETALAAAAYAKGAVVVEKSLNCQNPVSKCTFFVLIIFAAFLASI